MKYGCQSFFFLLLVFPFCSTQVKASPCKKVSYKTASCQKNCCVLSFEPQADTALLRCYKLSFKELSLEPRLHINRKKDRSFKCKRNRNSYDCTARNIKLGTRRQQLIISFEVGEQFCWRLPTKDKLYKKQSVREFLESIRNKRNVNWKTFPVMLKVANNPSAKKLRVAQLLLSKIKWRDRVQSCLRGLITQQNYSPFKFMIKSSDLMTEPRKLEQWYKRNIRSDWSICAWNQISEGIGWWLGSKLRELRGSSFGHELKGVSFRFSIKPGLTQRKAVMVLK